MINLLTDDLPRTVTVDHNSYMIYTDFRDYIELQQMIMDGVDDYAIVNYICDLYMNEKPDDLKECVRAINVFMKGNVDGSKNDSHDGSFNGKKASRFAFSYKYDAPYIIGAFLECYGIDLMTCEYMHWWKFNALFDSLNENTELKKRIAYRMMDISKIKNKDEKKRIRRIQKQIAIPVVNVMSDEDIANAF